MVKKYEVKIKGITDMLFNKYDHELNKEKQAVSKDKIPEWEEQNWKRKAYLSKDGDVILPDVYILGAIRNIAFASGVQLSKKTGKKTISKAFIEGNLLIEQSPPVCNESDLKPFVSNVKINKATVMNTRPLVPGGWEAKFSIIDLNSMFGKDELENLISYAGKFNGVGDWRPKYGRFSVESIKEVV